MAALQPPFSLHNNHNKRTRPDRLLIPESFEDTQFFDMVLCFAFSKGVVMHKPALDSREHRVWTA